MILPSPLIFPDLPYVRRHGPRGAPYKDFKPWLRDEFQFRCVYCLHREKWAKDGWRDFQIDHVVPQSRDRSKIDSYENCVYCCASCNRTKQSRLLPDPCITAFSAHYRFEADGAVTPLTPEGDRLIELLRLNAAHLQNFRRGIFRTYSRLNEILEEIGDDLELLNEEGVPDDIENLLGYPSDLPDLRLERIQANVKPEGVEQCYFVLLERKEVPHLY